jgi:hypothetical protein
VAGDSFGVLPAVHCRASSLPLPSLVIKGSPNAKQYGKEGIFSLKSDFCFRAVHDHVQETRNSESDKK